jgi:hypothetical protein
MGELGWLAERRGAFLQKQVGSGFEVNKIGSNALDFVRDNKLKFGFKNHRKQTVIKQLLVSFLNMVIREGNFSVPKCRRQNTAHPHRTVHSHFL